MPTVYASASDKIRKGSIEVVSLAKQSHEGLRLASLICDGPAEGHTQGGKVWLCMASANVKDVDDVLDCETVHCGNWRRVDCNMKQGVSLDAV